MPKLTNLKPRILPSQGRIAYLQGAADSGELGLKGKSRDKIDGAVAAAMAVARCAADEGAMTTSQDWFTDEFYLA